MPKKSLKTALKLHQILKIQEHAHEYSCELKRKCEDLVVVFLLNVNNSMYGGKSVAENVANIMSPLVKIAKKKK